MSYSISKTFRHRAFCFFGLLSLATTPLFAQKSDTVAIRTSVNQRGLVIGLNAGLNQLYGDLSSANVRPTVGLLIAYPLGHVVSLNLLGDLGTLSAQQASFYNSIAKVWYAQAAFGGSVNLTNLFRSKSQRTTSSAQNSLSVYLAAGLISFNATAYSLTTDQVQRYTNGAGSHRTKSDNITAVGSAGVTTTHEIVIPIGLRYNRQLSKAVTLYGDLRYNFFSTDKLDATVDNDNTTLSTPNGGYIYGKLNDNNSRDSWASLSVGLAYQVGRNRRQ
ncbi:hypothetical protein [Fibrella forsythiae]|uniref:Outer membrane protein beta-barrel domain-containing protein n=1 Tax=Fibrella forsythiae TaxID=2817061 RepID=A0ABS3JDX5_9BACT|nr:hypothetical protein [Fibrella forsythiae]MBO0948199.1 hypothetical protein [Fibrella forsythiae]